jgi:hypothetical protein
MRMTRKLSEREKRMLLIGGVALAALGVFGYGMKGLDRWNENRSSLAAAKKKLGEVETDKVRLAGLMALVPTFETPQAEEKQTTLFREKLLEQLKKAGINPEPPQPLPGKKMMIAGASYRVVKVKCKAKCKFDQMLDFLANLKENPYCVGVEELQIRCDTKEPPEKRKDKDVEMDLVVSTFVKDVPGRPGEVKSVGRTIPKSR